MSNSRVSFSTLLRILAWCTVALTVFIVLWGAWVRISGSGAGCGDHWPLCNGEVIPSGAQQKTWIEFTHRLSTGVYGVMVVAQLLMARWIFPRGHAARTWCALTVLFTITEAAIGAKLVLFGLVDQSQSMARLIVMPLHLMNTSLLLFSAVVAALAVRLQDSDFAPLSPFDRRYFRIVYGALFLMLATGALASLGSHLNPSVSLLAGFAKDIDSSSHPAIRLRVLHPILGVVLPSIIIFAMVKLRSKSESISSLSTAYAAVAWMAAGTVGVGFLTLFLLAPVVLKLSHLTAVNLLIGTIAYAYFAARKSTGLRENVV